MFVFYWSPSYKYLLLDFHFHFFKFLAETFQNTVDSHFCFWLTTAYFPVFSAFSFMLVWRANGPKELHTGTGAKRLILCNIPWPIFNTPLAHVRVHIAYRYFHLHLCVVCALWWNTFDLRILHLFRRWLNKHLSIFEIVVYYIMFKWRPSRNVYI